MDENWGYPLETPMDWKPETSQHRGIGGIASGHIDVKLQVLFAADRPGTEVLIPVDALAVVAAVINLLGLGAGDGENGWDFQGNSQKKKKGV